MVIFWKLHSSVAAKKHFKRLCKQHKTQIEKELPTFRRSHRSCSIKEAGLKNFSIFARKHLCWSLFFNKVANLRPATLLKKRLQHRCFPVNIGKFLGTPILKNICERLFLYFRIFTKNFLENEKLANRKLRKIGKVGNLRKIVPSFPRKKFPRFPRFPSFRPGYLSCIPKFENESSKWKLYQCKP